MDATPAAAWAGLGPIYATIGLYYIAALKRCNVATSFNYEEQSLSLQGVGDGEGLKSLNEKRLEKQQTRCKESCSAMSNT